MNSFVVLQQFRLLLDLFDLCVWLDVEPKNSNICEHTHSTHEQGRRNDCCSCNIHSQLSKFFLRAVCSERARVCRLRSRNVICETQIVSILTIKMLSKRTPCIDWLRFWFGILHSENFPHHATALLLCINHIGDTNAPEYNMHVQHYTGATCTIRVNDWRPVCIFQWEPAIQYSICVCFSMLYPCKQKAREKKSVVCSCF